MSYRGSHNKVLYSGRMFTRTRAAILAALSTRIHAAIADTGGVNTVTTSITQPDFPRNVTATPGGTTANVTAVQVIINGTNENDVVIAETLSAFTPGTATAVTGSKAFKTITSIVLPSNGASVTTAIGTGSKIGLGDLLSKDTVFRAYLAGVKEGTAPTVAFSSTLMESNTVTLNSALNATDVIIDYYQS